MEPTKEAVEAGRAYEQMPLVEVPPQPGRSNSGWVVSNVLLFSFPTWGNDPI